MKQNVFYLLFALTFLPMGFGTLASCRAINERLGISTTIDAPQPDTPEWIVHEAIQAAILSYKENEAAGWARFRKLLHSSEAWSAATERTWREMRWATMRRKVYLFTKDKDSLATVRRSSPTYELAKTGEKNRGTVKRLFVVNERSDLPTPCEVQRDPKQGNAWRIVTTCLN